MEIRVFVAETSVKLFTVRVKHLDRGKDREARGDHPDRLFAFYTRRSGTIFHDKAIAKNRYGFLCRVTQGSFVLFLKCVFSRIVRMSQPRTKCLSHDTHAIASSMPGKCTHIYYAISAIRPFQSACRSRSIPTT